MSLTSINLLVDELAKQYICNFLSDEVNIYLKDNETLSSFAKQAFEHEGLYAFIITKDKKKAIVYIGKAEGNDRLRQHLTGKNKDNTQLASSVKTKHKNIREAIKNGYNVKLALIEDKQFKKSSLGCLEIECILKGIEQLKGSHLTEQSWNGRVG